MSNETNKEKRYRLINHARDYKLKNNEVYNGCMLNDAFDETVEKLAEIYFPYDWELVTDSETETVQCECGKHELIDLAYLDEGGTWHCKDCQQEQLVADSEPTKLSQEAYDGLVALMNSRFGLLHSSGDAKNCIKDWCYEFNIDLPKTK